MKRLLSILLATALMAASLAGCSGSTNGGTSGTEGTSGGTEGSGLSASQTGSDSLVVSLYAEVTSLDPQKTSGSWDTMVIRNMHDTLVRANAKGEVIPAVAEKWEISEDGLQYHFYLRDDVTFQDGTPMTAEDVKYSLERTQQSAAVKRFVNFLDHAEVVNDYEIILHLTRPTAGTLKALASAPCSIVSQSIIERVGDDNYAQQPCGTGPYKLKEWISGDRVVLEAYDDYYLGAPAIKNLTIRTIKESTTAMIAFETGELDMIINAPELDKLQIQSQPEKYSVQETSSPVFWTLMLNNQQAPFDNKLVRNAIAMAIDPQELIDVVVDGQGSVAQSRLHPTTNGYVAVERRPYDPEQAKALLAEAGYPDGFDTKIYVRDDFTQKTGQVIQQQLAKIGINVEVEVMQFAAWLTDAGEGKFTMWPMGLLDAMLDCEIPLSQLLSSGIGTGTSNYARYSNPAYDEAFDKMCYALDDDERKQYVKEMLEIDIEDNPSVPLYFQMSNILYYNNIQGVEVYPNNMYFFYDMSKAAA